MKHRTSHSTMPYALEEIEITLHVRGNQIAVAFESEIPVTVDFSYIPGWPAITDRDPMECEEGAAPEIEILAVTPTLQAFIEVTDEDEKVQAALVLDAGRCLLWMLTDDQLDAIEKAVEKYMNEGEAL